MCFTHICEHFAKKLFSKIRTERNLKNQFETHFVEQKRSCGRNCGNKINYFCFVLTEK